MLPLQSHCILNIFQWFQKMQENHENHLTNFFHFSWWFQISYNFIAAPLSSVMWAYFIFAFLATSSDFLKISNKVSYFVICVWTGGRYVTRVAVFCSEWSFTMKPWNLLCSLLSDKVHLKMFHTWSRIWKFCIESECTCCKDT